VRARARPAFTRPEPEKRTGASAPFAVLCDSGRFRWSCRLRGAHVREAAYSTCSCSMRSPVRAQAAQGPSGPRLRAAPAGSALHVVEPLAARRSVHARARPDAGGLAHRRARELGQALPDAHLRMPHARPSLSSQNMRGHSLKRRCLPYLGHTPGS
jgi:hypothetical protein